MTHTAAHAGTTGHAMACAGSMTGGSESGEHVARLRLLSIIELGEERLRRCRYRLEVLLPLLLHLSDEGLALFRIHLENGVGADLLALPA